MALWKPVKSIAAQGFSLVEILIAMALMGFVMLSISNFVVKSNVNSSSLSMRFKEANEIHAVIQDIQADLHRGAYISPNSFDKRLEYTTYDPVSGNAAKKVYGICYYSTAQTTGTDTTCAASSVTKTIPYLKLSTDGGSTWGSPYRISGFNQYRMTGTPLFLYTPAYNGCLDFVDTNQNGVWSSGEGVSSVACGTSANSYWGFSSLDMKPEKSSKVILANFAFTTGKGNPEALRSLPPYIFIAVAPGLVRSTMAAVSPGVKDPMLVQYFSTDPTTNFQFPTGFIIRGLAWDRQHEVLVLSPETGGKLYRTERDGVVVNSPFTISDPNSSVSPWFMTMEGDGQTVMAINNDGSDDYRFYRFTLSGGTTITPITGPILVGNGAYRRAAAFSPKNPNYFYVPSAATSPYRIEQRDKTSATVAVTGATVNVDYWELPAAYSNPSYLSGMFIEPVNENFYVLLNNVYTSGGRNYVDVYKIVKSTGTATLDFSIDLTELGSSATGVNGRFQIAYDPDLNRIFMSDRTSNRVYEIVPPKLLSPRT